MLELRVYTTAAAPNVFEDWLRKMRDTRARAAIIRRMARVELGNFGDHKPCREGVWEMRIDVGPGYRAYYARSGKTVILLLCGGDKRTQDSDITRACAYWREWQHRNVDQEYER